MLSETILKQLLITYPVFHDVPASLQYQVCRTASYLKLSANQFLFQEGSICRTFVILLTGRVQVVKTDAAGRELMLYRFHPGDSCILTVSCLLGNQSYTASGILAEPITAVSIPKPLFIDLVTQSEQFRVFVFRFFDRRLTQLIQLVEKATFQTLSQRLASVLLSHGPIVRTTHQQLANELGSVREVVSRVLREFKERGAIDLQRGKIQIVNKVKLERFLKGERDICH